MRLSIMATCGLLLVGVSLPAVVEAQGLLRRVPAVGEYAEFAVVMLVTCEDPQVATSQPERAGTLRISCVGQQDLDGVPHYWLEACVSIEGEEDQLCKVLTGEEQILSGTVPMEFVRGWSAMRQPGQAVEATRTLNTGEPDLEQPALLILRFVHCGPGSEPHAGSSAKTLTINGQEQQFTQMLSGTLSSDLLDMEAVDELTTITMKLIGANASVWPADDVAFGVVAAEQVWQMSFSAPALDATIYYEMGISMDLTATGTDATSEFPDQP